MFVSKSAASACLLETTSTYLSLVVHSPPDTLSPITSVLASLTSRTFNVLVPAELETTSPLLKEVKAATVKVC